MGLAELHIHSRSSDGIAEVQEILDYVQSNTSLDVIAITDHETMRGAHQAQELVAKNSYRFEVVPGMEVCTNVGHLLGLFLRRPVPSYEPLAATIQAIHEQEGICIIPHPTSRQRDSITRRDLERLLAMHDISAHPDGLEILDPRVAKIMNLEDVATLNRSTYHLAEVGNSDAHAPSVIATRYTLFPGRTGADLLKAIRARLTRPWSGVPPAGD